MTKRKNKKKSKSNFGRDWICVNAHFRRSGPMKDQKKERNKKKCRKNYNQHIRTVHQD